MSGSEELSSARIVVGGNRRLTHAMQRMDNAGAVRCAMGGCAVSNFTRLAVITLSLLAGVSCSTTERGAKAEQTRLDRGWPKSKSPPPRATYPVMKVAIPQVADAEYVNNDCALQSLPFDLRRSL